HVSDAQRNGGEDFIYRLYIRPPRPDFDLRVVPSSIMARPGETVPITVHAMRQDGFDDQIALELVEPPPGFVLRGGTVPAKAEKVRMTLTVPPTATEEPFLLEMDGQSVGRRQRRFSRPAVPAESMMQAFLWLQVVPAEQWTVILNGKPAAKLPVEFPPIEQLKLKLDESTPLGARLTGKRPAANEISIKLSDPPDGISVEKTTPEGPGVVAMLKVDPEKVKPGLSGNLIFEVFREWTPKPTEAIPKPESRTTSYGILPAIPFEVVGRATRK
ncbi:MAG: peptidase, partial [Planctomycetota bacterium]